MIAGGNLIWAGFADAFRLLARLDPATVRIATLSLAVSGLATVLAAFVGIPAGAALALNRFRGRGLVAALVHTGMGLPPVVVGLGITILLWRSGPLGPLDLLYTPAAMVIAQFVVATPLAAGLTRVALEQRDADLLAALRADGAGEWAVGYELVRASANQVLVAIAAAFGRAISEVGASLMVGGNILNATRVLTTAIALETSKGDFARALALGMILLACSFGVNVALARGVQPRY